MRDEVEEFNVIREGLFDKAGVPYDGLEYMAPPGPPAKPGGMTSEEAHQAWREHLGLDALIEDQDDVRKTESEWFASLDLQAAVDHLEWLRGLRISTGMMAELIGAAVTGEHGGQPPSEEDEDDSDDDPYTCIFLTRDDGSRYCSCQKKADE